MADILETFNQRLYATAGNDYDGVVLSQKQDPYQYLKVEKFFDKQSYLGFNWSTTMGAKVIEPLLGEYYGGSYRVDPIELEDKFLQLPQERDEANQALQTTIRFGVDGGEEHTKDISYFIWRINNDRAHQVGALVIAKTIPEAIGEMMKKTATNPLAASSKDLLRQAEKALNLG